MINKSAADLDRSGLGLDWVGDPAMAIDAIQLRRVSAGVALACAVWGSFVFFLVVAVAAWGFTFDF